MKDSNYIKKCATKVPTSYKMKWLICLCIIEVASFCLSLKQDTPIIVNEYLDQTLDEIDTRTGDSTLNIAYIKTDKFTLYDITFSNAKTLKRSGDALMWSDGRKVSISGDVTFEKLSMQISSLNLIEKKTSINKPDLNISTNLLHFLFQAEIDTKSGCKVTVETLAWKRIGGTIFCDHCKYNNTNFQLSDNDLKGLNDHAENSIALKYFFEREFQICPKQHYFQNWEPEVALYSE